MQSLLTFVYAVLFSGMGVVFGTNRIRWSKANPSDFFDLVPSWILATTIAFFANLFLGYLPGGFNSDWLSFLSLWFYYHPISDLDHHTLFRAIVDIPKEKSDDERACIDHRSGSICPTHSLAI